MRALVIGGGLIGLTTAHYLAERGVRVTLIDAGPRPASGASHANGGLITPSMSDPWNAPGVTWQLLRWLGRADAPLLLRPRGLRGSGRWMLRFVRASSPQAWRTSTLRNMRLAAYSVRCLQRLRHESAIDYGAGTRGTMKVFRDRRSFDTGQVLMELAVTAGLQVRPLDRAATIATEPALGPIESDIVGSHFYPGDETGDARLFCERLAARLTQHGCDLRYGTSVQEIVADRHDVRGVRTGDGLLEADSYVLAAGAWSARLLKPLRIDLPVQPVKGYSISVPIAPWAPGPLHGIVDDTLHAAATPIGPVLRVAGTAEFSGFDVTVQPARIANLQRLVDALYPRASAAARGPDIGAWAGLRPMSADGVPVVGRTRFASLFVNTGHGPLGWTMAAGSGQLLADLITQRPSGIDAADYALERFG